MLIAHMLLLSYQRMKLQNLSILIVASKSLDLNLVDYRVWEYIAKEGIQSTHH